MDCVHKFDIVIVAARWWIAGLLIASTSAVILIVIQRAITIIAVRKSLRGAIEVATDTTETHEKIRFLLICDAVHSLYCGSHVSCVHIKFLSRSERAGTPAGGGYAQDSLLKMKFHQGVASSSETLVVNTIKITNLDVKNLCEALGGTSVTLFIKTTQQSNTQNTQGANNNGYNNQNGYSNQSNQNGGYGNQNTGYNNQSNQNGYSNKYNNQNTGYSNTNSSSNNIR